MPRFSEMIGAAAVMPGELIYIWYSQNWIARGDGYVRVCLIGGGGGPGARQQFTASTNQVWYAAGGGGGAGAMSFWGWRKIRAGESINFAIGGGGGANVSVPGTHGGGGGWSDAYAPWGHLHAEPGYGGAPGVATGNNAGSNCYGGAGGQGGGRNVTNCDYCYWGGDGGPGTTSHQVSNVMAIASGGGALNPLNKPVDQVSGRSWGDSAWPIGHSYDLGQSLTPEHALPIPGWLGLLTGAGYGNGGCSWVGGGGGTQNGNANGGGQGIAIVEFCKSV
jgi:hypothetical protein